MRELPVHFDDVCRARERIRAYVRHTPLESSASLSEALGVPAYLKLECWQPTRSFKVRGAFNAVLSLTAAERARGLVTASAGNHGQAVALAARAVGAAATVVVPETAPRTKTDRIRRLGATLCHDAADYDAAEKLAFELADSTGAVFIHPYSDAVVMAGQGTIGLEIIEDLADVDAVVVPVGGGGLISGIGSALLAQRPNARIHGVQSTQTHAMHAAFEAGRPVDVPIPPTLADGLAGCTDETAFRATQRVTDRIVLVTEADIAAAIRRLHADDGIVAEGSGAVGVAAALAGQLDLTGPTVFIISGGNIDGRRLAEILGN